MLAPVKHNRATSIWPFKHATHKGLARNHARFTSAHDPATAARVDAAFEAGDPERLAVPAWSTSAPASRIRVMASTYPVFATACSGYSTSTASTTSSAAASAHPTLRGIIKFLIIQLDAT